MYQLKRNWRKLFERGAKSAKLLCRSFCWLGILCKKRRFLWIRFISVYKIVTQEGPLVISKRLKVNCLYYTALKSEPNC